MDKRDEAIKKLKEHNQEHILNTLETMGKLGNISENVKKELYEQILEVDFEQLRELYENTKKELEYIKKQIEPIEYLEQDKLTKEQKEEFRNLALEVVENNQYAVVTMAGGQGTRLGHNGPKGTFKLDIFGKGKYLFEILTEKLKEANKKYRIELCWYIMTSSENNEETKSFLEKNNYFGYNKEKVVIFKQAQLPLVDTEGKILLDKNVKIKEAADGNGGIYSSLRNTGCLAKMKEDGIKWIFVSGIDNSLIQMVDLDLIGLTISKGCKIGAKSIVKINPHEKAGVFCKANKKPAVIEYSEITKKMAEARDENGQLKFGEMHIICNLYSIEAIEKVSTEYLMYHHAFKKNSYLNSEAKEIIPEKENTYKFESFIFDAFQYFDEIAILRGKREDNFAPVKNKEGEDSPKTAKELYEQYHIKNKTNN